MMKKINCPICFKTNNCTDDVSVLCSNCKCLINLKVSNYDYANKGGQNIPDKKKHDARLENCKLRFNIIKKYSDKYQTFVDVGTGSGEMIIVGKKFFNHSIGFEPSKELNDYYKEHQIEVYNSEFDYKKIQPFLKKNINIFYSLNHVLEHNPNPIKLISDISFYNKKIAFYIEVPLYTGISFKDQGFNWKLWYDQHYALYSIDTLKYISKELNMQILEHGFRTFSSDSYSFKKNLFLFIKHPIRFLNTCLLYFTNNKHTFMDIFLRDYGYIIIKYK